jgi:uncharacterized protein (DUF362 family)
MLTNYSILQARQKIVNNKVSLVKSHNDTANVKQALSEALNLIDYKSKSSINTIAIKVNLCYYWNASTGYTTDPRLVEALIDHLREIYGNDVEIKIVEADASAMRTKYAFPILGFDRLAEQKKVALFNLSEDVIEEKEVQVNNRKIVFQVPRTLLQSDLFINAPKLKTMRETHITCALKNIFGCIAYPRKVTYHPFLEEAIVGINKILKPHLNVVDGLVALGRFPVRLNLLMASEDSFSVDWVAAQVMGYKPSQIKFLNLATKEALGNPKNIKVLGEKIETFRKDFPTENNFVARVKMGLQLSLLKTYSRISGDIIPPSIEET